MIELTAAVALSLSVASASLLLITQHTYFMKQVQAFQFLREEAPQVNRSLTSILSSSNDYWIYDGKSDAFGNGSKANVGKALLLGYRNPSGVDDRMTVVFETGDDWKRLNLYSYRNGWPVEANWTITSLAEDITFSDAEGVLSITMTGPRGEEVTYMGGTR